MYRLTIRHNLICELASMNFDILVKPFCVIETLPHYQIFLSRMFHAHVQPLLSDFQTPLFFFLHFTALLFLCLVTPFFSFHNEIIFIKHTLKWYLRGFFNVKYLLFLRCFQEIKPTTTKRIENQEESFSRQNFKCLV